MVGVINYYGILCPMCVVVIYHCTDQICLIRSILSALLKALNREYRNEKAGSIVTVLYRFAKCYLVMFITDF